MRRKTLNNLISIGAGILIAVPVCVAKVNYARSLQEPEQNVRELTPAMADYYIAQNVETASIEPQTEVEVVRVALPIVEEATTEYIEPVFEPYSFIPWDSDFQQQVKEICDSKEISYDLVLAIAKTESEFQWKIGDNGQATGYMQIWAKWWQGLADSKGLDINSKVDNVNLGIDIILQLLDSNNGDLEKALKEYNTGNPNYTSNYYVDKVYEALEWIEVQKNGN